MNRLMIKLITASLFLLVGKDAVAKPASIGFKQARNYQVAEQKLKRDSQDSYQFVCAVSQANSKRERAHTMIKVITDLAKLNPDSRFLVYLAPHPQLCQVGRLIGTAYYNPTGEVWKSVRQGKWTWNVLTTSSKISPQKISDTVIYETNKTAFKQRYGELDYHAKLDQFVRKTLGRKPRYITSGMWVDTYFVE